MRSPNRPGNLLSKAQPLGIPLFPHNKEPFAVALCGPEFADVAFFLGVVGGDSISAFILDHQNPPVVEQDDKVGVEAVG